MEKIKTISVEQMRKSDAWTIANLVSSKELMKRAGDAIYNQMIKAGCGGPVAIVCGSGNNAGDGYVVAANLAANNIDCEIILATEKFSDDGKYYFDKCQKLKIPIKIYENGMLNTYPKTDNQNADKLDLSKYNTIVDCLLGTGFSGQSVRSNMADLINAINKSNAFVVSADINSGLNGDTGDGQLYVISDLTVSIGFFKHGHFKGKAKSAMKNKVNCDIGIKLISE